jgi:cellulose synthase/poly-beta-1,6-N-acetylglucosamine synthase-like glycosyltransferase
MSRLESDDVQARTRLSLVIPVRNEEESLPVLIEGIRLQTLAPAEVIIVDGGSTDRTVELARRLTAGDERFLVLDAGDGTPGRNRNVGAEAAVNEWVAFTDAGTRPESDWLERLAAETNRDSSVEVVYGNYEPIENSFFERCAALSYPPAKVERPGGLIRAPSTASMMLRREVWRKAGGFPDMRAAEDLIFISRLESQGHKIAWAPRATVWWQLQPTLARTFRKFVLYSKHNVWAGLQWDWHYGIARQYAMVSLFILLGILHRPFWLWGLLLWLVARAFRSIWRRREGRGLLWALNPVRFVGVAMILLTIDLATFVGWIQAKITRPP